MTLGVRRVRGPRVDDDDYPLVHQSGCLTRLDANLSQPPVRGTARRREALAAAVVASCAALDAAAPAAPGPRSMHAAYPLSRQLRLTTPTTLPVGTIDPRVWPSSTVVRILRHRWRQAYGLVLLVILLSSSLSSLCSSPGFAILVWACATLTLEATPRYYRRRPWPVRRLRRQS